jgi:hypothetical protein
MAEGMYTFNGMLVVRPNIEGVGRLADGQEQRCVNLHGDSGNCKMIALYSIIDSFIYS